MEYDDYDFYDPIKREMALERRAKERAEERKEWAEKKKKLKKSYLKGQRGRRKYFDYDKLDYSEIDDNDYADDFDIDSCDEREFAEHPIKCVYTRDLRRKSLFKYFKYLNGKMVAVRDLAWKFAVTERTIQNDLKWLVDEGFVNKVTNVAKNGKQTQNTYIVHPEKEIDFPCKYSFIQFVFLAKQNDKWQILLKTDYDESKCVRGKININNFNFYLPSARIYSENKIENKSLEVATKIFKRDLQEEYKGVKFKRFSSHIYTHHDYNALYYDKTISKKIETKDFFVLFVLDEMLESEKGYRWISLSTAPKRLKSTRLTKGINFITKNCLG